MSKPKSKRLNALVGELKKVDDKLIQLKVEKSGLDKDIFNYTKKKSSLESQIKDLKNAMRETIVSDHAIVRYFERVLGIDIDDVKEEILKQERHKNVVKDNTIVTVIENEE